MERYVQIFNIALDAVFSNKFRSMLTALGIIFGVAAVIAMMAIGNGAKKEILDQIKLVGVNNIIVEAKNVSDLSSSDEEGKKMAKQFSPGLSMDDAQAFIDVIPGVANISPEVVYEATVMNSGVHGTTSLNGVTVVYFDIYALALSEGKMFTPQQEVTGASVCILGATIAAKYFPSSNPIGKRIKCGHIWLQVVGVLENRMVDAKAKENLGVADYNNEVFAPLNTVFLRFKDRSVINPQTGGSGFVTNGHSVMITSSYSSGGNENAINQLDKITVKVENSNTLTQTADVMSMILNRRHYGVGDFSIKVPELLLKQEQRTKDIFNIVLGAIAGISLIVGGIGIMNIMLASVMERIKEIGLRKAVGARKNDIVLQFLMEAVLISVVGGLVGILIGVILARLIMEFTDILTIVSSISIIISFGVSVSVGVLFGYMPSKKAAAQDAVESLRHD